MSEKSKGEIEESDSMKRARIKAQRRKKLSDLKNEIQEFAAKTIARIDEIIEIDREK